MLSLHYDVHSLSKSVQTSPFTEAPVQRCLSNCSRRRGTNGIHGSDSVWRVSFIASFTRWPPDPWPDENRFRSGEIAQVGYWAALGNIGHLGLKSNCLVLALVWNGNKSWTYVGDLVHGLMHTCKVDLIQVFLGLQRIENVVIQLSILTMTYYLLRYCFITYVNVFIHFYHYYRKTWSYSNLIYFLASAEQKACCFPRETTSVMSGRVLTWHFDWMVINGTSV